MLIFILLLGGIIMDIFVDIFNIFDDIFVNIFRD